MSMTRPGAVPRVPTPPRGEEVASYATYLEAQKAVDFLSDNKFAVELVTIVGTDLRMVERVTGRLTYGRVAFAGLASGAWFGLFVGVLLWMFSGQGGLVLVGSALGAGFGLLFSVLSYSLARGRRDFTSSSQIVASSYAILCVQEGAGEARRLLSTSSETAGGLRRPANPAWGVGQGGPGSTSGVPAPGATGPENVQPPRTAPDPRWTTPTGEPRYGAMRPTADLARPVPEASSSTAPAPDAGGVDESADGPATGPVAPTNEGHDDRGAPK